MSRLTWRTEDGRGARRVVSVHCLQADAADLVRFAAPHTLLPGDSVEVVDGRIEIRYTSGTEMYAHAVVQRAVVLQLIDPREGSDVQAEIANGTQGRAQEVAGS